eukprot:5948963-Amphidinium_carterae.1
MEVVTLAANEGELASSAALPCPSNVSGLAITEHMALMLEVCAGSALLCSCFQAKGWQVRAVDWSRRSLGSIPHIKADTCPRIWGGNQLVVQELISLAKCLCLVL